MEKIQDLQRSIQILETQYKEKKIEFDKWREENAALSDNEEFKVYVNKFYDWERVILENRDKLKAALAQRKLIEKPSELPTVDLDTQLENALNDVTLPQFVLAFLTMAHKDPPFLKKAFEVVIEESRSTGYSNPILPQKAVISSQSTPSFGGYHQAPSAVSSNISSHSIPNTSNGIYLPPPSTTQQKQLVVLSSARYSSQSSMATSSGYNNTQQQMTNYGLLPEGWKVDPAIRKQQKHSSPTREYQSPINLPFKDFSQC